MGIDGITGDATDIAAPKGDEAESEEVCEESALGRAGSGVAGKVVTGV